jgi:hypothetical protein
MIATELDGTWEISLIFNRSTGVKGLAGFEDRSKVTRKPQPLRLEMSVGRYLVVSFLVESLDPGM